MVRIVVVIAALAVAALVLDYATGAMIRRKAWLILAGENWASDGPLLGFAGGALSGPVANAPADWSFTSDTYVVEIEVRPDDPYSVNLLCASVGDRLYVASGSGPDATWVRALRQNPALRLRVGDRIYELRATRVTDSAEIDVYLDAFEEKYAARPQRSEFIPSGAEAEPVAPLFGLSPPAATGERAWLGRLKGSPARYLITLRNDPHRPWPAELRWAMARRWPILYQDPYARIFRLPKGQARADVSGAPEPRS
jgi:hypothetical protein